MWVLTPSNPEKHLASQALRKALGLPAETRRTRDQVVDLDGKAGLWAQPQAILQITKEEHDPAWEFWEGLGLAGPNGALARPAKLSLRSCPSPLTMASRVPCMRRSCLTLLNKEPSQRLYITSEALNPRRPQVATSHPKVSWQGQCGFAVVARVRVV